MILKSRKCAENQNTSVFQRNKVRPLR